MDYRVSWSPTALDDVDAIAEYINRDSPAYTRAVVNKILDTARKLEDFQMPGESCQSLMTRRSANASSTATVSSIASRSMMCSSLPSFTVDGFLNHCSIKLTTRDRMSLSEKSRVVQKVAVPRMRRHRNNVSRGLRWRNRIRSCRSSYGLLLYKFF